MANQIEFIIQPLNEDYDPNDDRWINQVNDLLMDLQRGVGNVRKEVSPIPGKKGGLESLILSLGSGELITAAIEAFKAWINRDKNRILEISIMRDGKEEIYRVSSNRMDKADIRNFMNAAFQLKGTE